MANLWNDLTKWFEDASKVIGKEAGDLTQKGQLKLKLFESKRLLKDLYSQFGINVYNEAIVKKHADWDKKDNINTLIRKIRGLQSRIRTYEKEYSQVGGKTTKKRKDSGRN